MSMSILHPWPPAERPGPRQLAKAWYQALMASPGLGQQVVQRMGFVPRALTASRKVGEWTPEELEVYGERFRDPARARATVLLYRTVLTRELRPILAGLYRGRRLTVPALLLVGAEDDLLKDNPLTGYEHDADRHDHRASSRRGPLDAR